ncbi:hypothetical protein [Acinetobacter sp. MD2(2019)]|uniref:hypothetical protein n=1 Tax=Acinetobacter sp. MD2(2019) TaxID=2605273 RepID=UPI002D1F8171|nr:hypothetical protein [Acinetobacter sp. MD2(2019)]MEB3753005.1 hypothetical protein [Acinetobacter sp. MD2(2019)]
MQENRKHSSLLLWIVITTLAILCAGLFAWQYLVVKEPASAPNKINSAQPNTHTASEVQTAAPTQEASVAQTSHALVNQDLTTQAIPQNPALAQEEIDKLNDIQKQLQAQESILKAQQQDADKLIQLKQEQIKLLEQQIASKP